VLTPLTCSYATATSGAATGREKKLQKPSLEVALTSLGLVLLIRFSIQVCFSAAMPELVFLISFSLSDR